MIQDADLLAKYGRDKDYRDWSETIRLAPALNFPSHWDVRMVPPFGGAAARFTIDGLISVYLDMDGSLGVMSQPYWEVYPAQSGYEERFLLHETKELIAEIAASRRRLRREARKVKP